jgi:hypothetical protein
MSQVKHFIRVLGLLAWLATAPAFAFTYSTVSAWNGTTPITSGTTTSISAGQAEIVTAATQSNNPAGGGTPTHANVQVTDMVDGTSFTNCGFYWDSAHGAFASVYLHVVVNGGTRTIKIATTVSSYVYGGAVLVSGFSGTPTCDSALNITGGSATSTTSVVIGPAATGHNTELAVYTIVGMSTVPSAPSYTLMYVSNPSAGYNYQAAAGASVAISATAGGSMTWDGIISGVYDAGGSGTVNSGTAGCLGYYATTGTAISPTAACSSTSTLSDLQAQTAFTIAGTGCTPTVTAPGPFGGTFTLASGPCTAVTITINGATGFTAPNGYHCSVHDRTALAGGTWIPAWGETTSTVHTATLPIPGAAGTSDVISFNCDWF